MTVDKGILIKNIYYMLTYAFKELRRNNYEDIAGEEFSTIYDLLAEILYKATAYQLKKGLFKAYEPTKEVLSTIRGKIDLAGSIRQRLQRRLRLECEFDEFTEDNLFNRIIKSTLILLIKSNGLEYERRQNLSKILVFFRDVTECDLREVRWSQLTYDRNSSTYQILHQICYFICHSLLLTTDCGRFSMQHFSEKTLSWLFEKFVLNYYRRHYPIYEVRASKVEWDIKEEATSLSLLPDMQTDIMIRFPNKTLIIDTKYYEQSLSYYKGNTTYNSGHLYQIQSYIYNEDKGHTGDVDGMVLYAQTQEEMMPCGEMQLARGNRIYFRSLDLNGDFRYIKRQLDSYIKPYL